MSRNPVCGKLHNSKGLSPVHSTGGTRELIGNEKTTKQEIKGRDPAPQERATPLVIIGYERGEQRKLCDNLELIADQLPTEIDRELCRDAYERLHAKLPVYHRNEEALFGLIDRRASPALKLSKIVSHVREEHALHDCYADEFNEFLHALDAGRNNQNYDMFGYMLRCFFETMRHHLQWEEMTLMPMAGQLLTTPDLSELADVVAKNRSNMDLSFSLEASRLA